MKPWPIGLVSAKWTPLQPRPPHQMSGRCTLKTACLLPSRQVSSFSMKL